MPLNRTLKFICCVASLFLGSSICFAQTPSPAATPPLSVPSLSSEQRMFDSIIEKEYVQKNATRLSDTLVRQLERNPALEVPMSNFVGIIQKSGPLQVAQIDAIRALIYMGKSTGALSLTANALFDIPFNLVDPTEWLFLCQKIASKSVSVVGCAQRLLREPKFEFALLGAGSKVNKNVALVMLLLSMPEKQWLRWAQDALWAGSYRKFPGAQEALMEANYYAVSLRSDAILAKLLETKDLEPNDRTHLEKLMTQIRAMEQWSQKEQQSQLFYKELQLSKDADELSIRDKRRSLALSISQVNIISVEKSTFLIRQRALENWKTLQKQGRL